MSPRNRSAPTIGDVASRAGVSVKTVSRVVNGEKYVREELREAVMSAIRALNYTPNQAARSLVGGKEMRIGLLYCNPSSAYMAELMLGVFDASSRLAAQLMVERCVGADERAQRAVIAKLIAGGVSGVLLPPPLCESEIVLSELAKHALPAVAISPGSFNAASPSVRIDEYAAAREMTDYLLGLGHRRIGFIKGHPNQHASAERLRGFADALAAARIAVDPALIVQGYFDYRSGMDAAGELLALEAPPTAIFASNDDMASAAINVAHRLHLDVPRDLSVVGFDDTPISSATWPSLTTIRQPVAEMADTGLGMLFRELRRRARDETDTEPTHRLAAHALIVRESADRP